MKWNIFSWLKEIIQTKSNYKTFTPEQWKSFDCYLINLFLSMNPDYVELVDEIQEVEFDKEKLYRIYSNFIPRSNKTYSPYIKSKTLKLKEEKLKYVSSLYEISLKEANDYIDLKPKEWFKDLLSKHGLDKKEITKINKL
jgi:hypothetical protein